MYCHGSLLAIKHTWIRQCRAGPGTATLLLLAWPRPALGWSSPQQHLAPALSTGLLPGWIHFDSPLFRPQQIIPSSGCSFAPLLCTHLLGCLHRSVSSTSPSLTPRKSRIWESFDSHLSSLLPYPSVLTPRAGSHQEPGVFLFKNVSM